MHNNFFLIYIFLIVFVPKLKAQTKYDEENDVDIHWSYDDQEHWPLVFCRNGTQQSPIPLSQNTSLLTDLKPLVIENFDEEYLLDVSQNGHTVVVEIPEDCYSEIPKLSGGKLTENYTLSSFHYHWPSEHTIEGIQYSLESHFVFFATKYVNYTEALKHPFGLTVIGVLYQETNYTESDNFEVIAEAVKETSGQLYTKVRTSTPINLNDFLPSNQDIFFSYEGSLTTPNCSEYVNWIVFKDTSIIKNTYYMDLKHIKDENGTLLEFTNRDLQEINGRTINLQKS
ncbi:carbonic anhydrase 6-like [Sitophilus oryzae]|uniref:carbonic anhydrase n=1 Tax=Sitophilus oryzae TaxID=7048 RepID=A0A6J2XS75_SITOR|nr:carbonic anhydrase 6-like [Sitophilus oryzae]